MRTLVKTEAYDEFFATLPKKVQVKIDYVMDILIHYKVVSSKFVKKLENTDYYELRISVDNEYRVLLFSIDHENIIEATRIILLNGFLKSPPRTTEGK